LGAAAQQSYASAQYERFAAQIRHRSVYLCGVKAADLRARAAGFRFSSPYRRILTAEVDRQCYAIILACAQLTGCSSAPAFAPSRSRGSPVDRSTLACRGWRVVKSANASSVNNQLYAVAASATGTLWAVGGYEAQTYKPFLTLAERWDGKSWSVVATPNVGSGDNQLAGVAAFSDSDVWAVGARNPTSTAQTQPLIEHWDGSAWRVVRSPTTGQLGSLGTVAVVSTNDAWAAGGFFNAAGNQQTLVEHWNGKKWSIVASPSPGYSYNSIGGLAVISAKDIWATGSTSNDGGNTLQTLVERWNGKQWSVVSSPNVPGAIYSDLGRALAISARDVLAIGSSESAPTYATRTLIEQWDGNQWNIVATPDNGTGGNSLGGISMGTSSELWAVGSYIDKSSELNRTLIEERSDSAWSIVKSPNPGATYDQLRDVTSNSIGSWAVGTQQAGRAGLTLIEYHC
jgi:hypothetical protein